MRAPQIYDYGVEAPRSCSIGACQGLEGRRLISRATPKNDQRTKQLFIKPEGARLLDETRENIARVQERILAPLGKEQRVFMQYLAKLVQLNNDLSRAPLRAAK